MTEARKPEMVTTIPSGFMSKVGRISAKEYPVTIVYEDQRLRLSAWESAAFVDGKLAKV